VSYTLCFERKGKIRIVISKEGERSVFSGGDVVTGVDVNIKHNLFSTSNGYTIDFDRELLKEFTDFLRKVDENKQKKRKENKSTKEISSFSVRERKIMDDFLAKMQADIINKCRTLVYKEKELGTNHLVMEDLGQMSKGFSRSDEFEGIKYVKLWNMLHLADLSNIVERLAYKQKMTFSLVHAAYTSKDCAVCGHSDDNNRKTQELFICQNCEHTNNADYNSPNNIKYRVVSNVLREKLLTQDKFTGKLLPRKMKRTDLRTILDNHSCSPDFIRHDFCVINHTKLESKTINDRVTACH
jgi:transposase